ncbi:hypothetical protein, partial [Staphylococcus epidermidis]|uniref:hypothetical protein n=1 Tax=Staphylococcus epidermidis TaxID=1282 RepID=UPI0028CB9DBE
PPNYPLNQIYLISHPLLQTPNPTSQLPKPPHLSKPKFTTKTPHKYHNLFPIPPFHNNPLLHPIKYPKNPPSTSLSKPIIPRAKFIPNSYVKAG